MDGLLDIPTFLSVSSAMLTAYFWLVKVRKEQPNLEFYQLSDFRTSCRRHPNLEGRKRFSIQQIDTGGVLIVNHSTRQNSVVLFHCYLETPGGVISGDWGYSGEDKPPWNVGPESTIAFSPACFFDVPEDFETPEELRFRIDFLTASGHRFSHHFDRHAPHFRSAEDEVRRAA